MMQRYASKRLSKEERRVDALALRAEERRDKLRKAAGEMQIILDPQMSEWKPGTKNSYHPYANP